MSVLNQVSFSHIHTVNIICVDKILSNTQRVCISKVCKLSCLLPILPILMELSIPCNGRNIRWFSKVSNTQLNQKRFLLSDKKISLFGLYQKNSYFEEVCHVFVDMVSR